MKQPGGYKRRARGPGPPVDPATELHRVAVKLFDQGDGRAVDWPAVAAALFKAGFSCLDEAGGSERARKVLRKIEGGAYNRLAGNPDDGTPYTTAAPPRQPAGSFEPAPGHDLHNG